MEIKRHGLVVGVTTYDWYAPNLPWCLNDALAMFDALGFHDGHVPNFACQLMLGTAPKEESDHAGARRVTYTDLVAALENLFATDDTIILYFAGHGIKRRDGVYLGTQDYRDEVPGLIVNDLLEMANESNTAKAREIVIILDCCFSGAIGQAGLTEMPLREGITLLAAAKHNQLAVESEGHGIFTRYVLDALNGGAADVRGIVTAASIYGYVDQALGPWDQRPIYKSHSTGIEPIRFCTPLIEAGELRRLPAFFSTPDQQYPLDRSYEVTCPEANPENLHIFRLFKHLQLAHLLRPSYGPDEDLYWVALRGNAVELTPLGRFYWELAKRNLITDTPVPATLRRPDMRMPNAESVAKLFHETYERLAPHYNYETRERTRVPWEQVPEQNKLLMIATAAEVLAKILPPEDEKSAGPAAEE